jgi:predicted acetyltransferase
MQLREVQPDDEAQFRAAIRDFAETDPGWEFAFDFSQETKFVDYIERLRNERQGLDIRPGRVRHTFLIAVHDENIVGRLSLRHELNEFLLGFGGHIGFGVIPSARRRGFGTQILRQSLKCARDVGIECALLTCDDQNQGSMRIIESCGGNLEDRRPREGGGMTCRYWIDI